MGLYPVGIIHNAMPRCVVCDPANFLVIFVALFLFSFTLCSSVVSPSASVCWSFCRERHQKRIQELDAEHKVRMDTIQGLSF